MLTEISDNSSSCPADPARPVKKPRAELPEHSDTAVFQSAPLRAASIVAGELVAGSAFGWGSLGRITKIGEVCFIT